MSLKFDRSACIALIRVTYFCLAAKVLSAPDEVTCTIRHLKGKDNGKFIVITRTVVFFHGLSMNLQLR